MRGEVRGWPAAVLLALVMLGLIDVFVRMIEAIW